MVFTAMLRAEWLLKTSERSGSVPFMQMALYYYSFKPINESLAMASSNLFSGKNLTLATKPPANCKFELQKTSTMGVWNQVAQYLWLKKRDPREPKSQFVRYMHGINRLSIILFLAGLVLLAIKLLRK